MVTFLTGAVELYIDITTIALIIQFFRWIDSDGRSFGSFMAGALMWPYFLVKECAKLTQ